jgi:hypothetical protein
VRAAYLGFPFGGLISSNPASGPVGQLVVFGRKIGHQDGRIGACHFGCHRPHLREPLANIAKL